MMIKSDWHIHSECSYDASLTLNDLEVEKYLISAGFTDGDFSEIADEHLW